MAEVYEKCIHVNKYNSIPYDFNRNGMRSIRIVTQSGFMSSSSSSLVSLINEYDYRQYLLMHPKVTDKSNSRGTGPSAMVTGNRGGRGD